MGYFFEPSEGRARGRPRCLPPVEHARRDVGILRRTEAGAAETGYRKVGIEARGVRMEGARRGPASG